MDRNIMITALEQLRSDSNFFINQLKQKDPNFLEKSDDTITEKEREVRWHFTLLQVLEQVIADNLKLKNDLKVAEEQIKNFKLARSILTNSVEGFNERLDLHERHVLQYLDELNDDVIDIKSNLKDNSSETSLSLQENKKPFLNLKPPSSDGEMASRPVQFLRALREYIEAFQVKNVELLPLLRVCLNKDAKNWLYLVDNKIKNLEDFEILFRERFWNEPIQSRIRSRFELGKWNRELKVSRVLYAQELIGYAQELELNISEAELITRIGRHFSESIISNTIRMQKIDTDGKLFDLLQDCDNKDEQYKERKSSKKYDSKKSRNKTKSPKSDENSEQKASDNDSKNHKKDKNSQFFSRNKNNNNGYKKQGENSQAQIRSMQIQNSANKQTENSQNSNGSEQENE